MHETNVPGGTHRPRESGVLQALAFGRRRLRLLSGLVLFVYVGLHLLNHALGLVSLELAEAGLKLSVALWHSLPGTALLYGAAAVHVALAFDALYRRRTLRMPVIEWVRLGLGFGMPILLIGHVVATRTAFELFGLDPVYSRVIRGIWASGNEWLQLGLLAPGWIHGCLGLHLAFGHRRFYRRAFLASYAAAVLLPFLAGIGFWSMSRDLERQPAAAPATTAAATTAGSVDARPPDSGGSTPPAPMQTVAAVRRNALNAYGALFVLIVVARAARLAVERRRRSLVAVELPNRRIELPRGWSVLDGLRSQGIAHNAVCGGRARCSTCRVRVLDGLARCPEPAADEARLLVRLGEAADVRLACQLRPQGDVRIEALVPRIEHHVERRQPRLSTEFDALLLRIGVAPATGEDGACLPADVLLVLQALIPLGESLVQRGGGQLAHLSDDHLLLAFDTRTVRPELLGRLIGEAESAADRMQATVLARLASRLQIAVHAHRGTLQLIHADIDHSRLPLALGEGVAALRGFALQDTATTRAAGAVAAVATPMRTARLARFTPQAARWLGAIVPEAVGSTGR